MTHPPTSGPPAGGPSAQPSSPPRAPTVRAWGEGDRRWFLNAWSTVAVAAEDAGGHLDVVTQELPPGYCPPAHRHARRDELLVVVDGEVHLTCDGARWLLGPGSTAHIPRGTVHALETSLAEPARVVFAGVPGGLGALVRELGTRPSSGEAPRPSAPDLAVLAAAGARHDHVLADAPGVPSGEAPSRA